MSVLCHLSSYDGVHTWSVSSLHFVSRQYLKNGMMDFASIWHVDVTAPQMYALFKVTLNYQQ